MENMETKNKNHSEFLSLFMTNYKGLYSYILAIVCNVSDADDLMQDTALFLWDHFEQYESGTNFGAWARAISRNKIFQHFDKTKKNPALLPQDVLNIIEKDLTLQLVEANDRFKALQKCLEKLSQPQRLLLQEKYDKGLHFSQIAEAIGNSANAIYKKMARIHHLLLQCINRTLKSENAV